MGVESERQRVVASVRKFRPADVDPIMAIMAESPQAATWSRESYVKFAEETGTVSLVIETDGEVRGFLVGRRVGDQAEVLNLAVAARRRRGGGGTALLTAALEEFRLLGGKSVYLEVRESNTGAIAFYKRHGFAITGRRPAYYRGPEEAALTMERKLTG